MLDSNSATVGFSGIGFYERLGNYTVNFKQDTEEKADDIKMDGYVSYSVHRKHVKYRVN